MFSFSMILPPIIKILNPTNGQIPASWFQTTTGKNKPPRPYTATQAQGAISTTSTPYLSPRYLAINIQEAYFASLASQQQIIKEDFLSLRDTNTKIHTSRHPLIVFKKKTLCHSNASVKLRAEGAHFTARIINAWLKEPPASTLC